MAKSRTIVQFHHGHTYGGNPIACAAGLAVLNEFLARDILSNVRLQGQRLRQRLDELAERFAIIGEVRGVGLLQGFEFVSDRLTKQRFEGHVRPGQASRAGRSGPGIVAAMRRGIRRFCSTSHRDWRGHRRDDPSAWRKPCGDRSEIDLAPGGRPIPKDRSKAGRLRDV